MKKVLNRNHLKIIALITMLIDHIAIVFFNNLTILRIIGRVSFPIFAFFIAQGYFYTKNKKKYVLLILIFALISQYPYYLAFQKTDLNILFTFLLSIATIYLIENNNKNNSIFSLTTLILYNILLIVLYSLNLISYGFFGVYIPVAFYFIKNKYVAYICFIILNFLITLPSIIFLPNQFITYVQLFAILAIPILMLYNGQKGKLNLKYLFYIFYPAHLIILYLLSLLI